MQGKPNGIFLPGSISIDSERYREGRTVTLNHERLNNIVTNEFKVGVTNPMADSGFRTSEKVVEDGHLVAEKHETVDEMRANETCTTGNKDSFALRRS